MGKITLFCIPSAGMSAVTYNNWRAYLSEDIDLYPVELAARGIRFRDNIYSNFDEAVNDVFGQVKDIVKEKPYAFFGHCMGSWIACEVCQKIRTAGYDKPNHIFFSGKQPPHIADEKDLHILPDNEFINEILFMGGTSKEIFEDENLLSLFMPVLRNDFKIVESYIYTPYNCKLDCDISVLYGKENKRMIKIAAEWEMYTNKNCYLYGFEGNQFFIHGEMRKVLDIVNYSLINTK